MSGVAVGGVDSHAASVRAKSMKTRSMGIRKGDVSVVGVVGNVPETGYSSLVTPLR